VEKVASKDEKILKVLEVEGHLPNYPFLRILYNTGSYYEF